MRSVEIGQITQALSAYSRRLFLGTHAVSPKSCSMVDMGRVTAIENRAGLNIKHWCVSSIKRPAVALACGQKAPNQSIHRTLRDEAAQRR